MTETILCSTCGRKWHGLTVCLPPDPPETRRMQVVIQMVVPGTMTEEALASCMRYWLAETPIITITALAVLELK